MQPQNASSDRSQSNNVAARAPRGSRWTRLCLKELRETLRDRRTLITLVLMPLLVYPVLSMVFQRSLLSSFRRGPQTVLIGVTSADSADFIRKRLEVAEIYLHKRDIKLADPIEKPGKEAGAQSPNENSVSSTPESSLPDTTAENPLLQLSPVAAVTDMEIDQISFMQHDDLPQQVRDEKVDLAILIPSESKSGRFELIHRTGSALSGRALEFVEDRLQVLNELHLRKRLIDADLSPRLEVAIERTPIQVESQDTTLSTIVPMILILMTVTGAVYPAIDLTAGERERGTLEMLMASPVSRLKLLLAKYVAVVTVAFLTALVNLTAMAITLQATGIGRAVFGGAGLSFVRVLQILALLVLFAAFFSAVLLALTSFARSFKEAQAYLIPLMLLSLGPGIVSLLPGLELNGLLAITPISNMVLLARDLCGGTVNPVMGAVAVLATGLYTLAAIGIAAKIFGADAVMSGGQGELRSLFLADENGTQKAKASSVSGALLCLAILFPIYFLMSSFLAQFGSFPISVRLVISGLATSFLFGVVPGIAAKLQRLDLRWAFGLLPSVLAAFSVAILLGLTLWPIAHEIVLFTQYFTNLLGFSSLSQVEIEQVQELLKQLRATSPLLILFSMAIAPAVFEELFFRGYLFHALRRKTTRFETILISAVLFGLFHVISNGSLSIERLLPSTFMGLVLGWICYQSGSVYPGMLLHACHNGLLMMMAYYKDELSAMGFGVEEQAHMPSSWIAMSVSSLLFGIVFIAWLPGSKDHHASSSV